MSLQGFQTLRCPTCDKTNVVQVGELCWQEGKGQAFRILGYLCVACQIKFDTEGAIKVLKKNELAEKIKELEASSGR